MSSAKSAKFKFLMTTHSKKAAWDGVCSAFDVTGRMACTNRSIEGYVLGRSPYDRVNEAFAKTGKYLWDGSEVVAKDLQTSTRKDGVSMGEHRPPALKS